MGRRRVVFIAMGLLCAVLVPLPAAAQDPAGSNTDPGAGAAAAGDPDEVRSASAPSAGGAVAAWSRPSARYKARTCLLPLAAMAEGNTTRTLSACGVTVRFSQPLRRAQVPGSWATWGAPPYVESGQPPVLATDSTSVRISFSQPVTAFGAEVESNQFAEHRFRASFRRADGTALGSVSRSVQGYAGARLLAGQATPRGSVSSVVVSSTDAFAMAQIRFSVAPVPQQTYAALGDSYSSGEGSTPIDASSGDCHRGPNAWPRRLSGASAALHVVAHIACSGATTDAFHETYHGEQPQLDQLRALDVDVVTVTIGGNDLGFAATLRECRLRDCVASGHLSRIAAELPAFEARVDDEFRSVAGAASSAKVYVVGYPRLFPSTQAEAVNCGWLEPEERRELNSLTKDLDQALRRAASAAGVRYISVLHALDGHELCSDDAWMRPINFGSSYDGHPTNLGQQAISAVVHDVIG